MILIFFYFIFLFIFFFFFFNDTATTEIYTLSLHDALPISFDLPLDEARHINVEGTREVIDFAREAQVSRFVHVSTAYVAGITRGEFREDQLDEGQEFRNTY